MSPSIRKVAAPATMARSDNLERHLISALRIGRWGCDLPNTAQKDNIYIVTKQFNWGKDLPNTAANIRIYRARCGEGTVPKKMLNIEKKYGTD